MLVMPKEAMVVCQECNAEFDGTLPDNRHVGYKYYSTNGEMVDPELVESIVEHHSETATVTTRIGNIMGHRYFDVFLKEGGMGELEVYSSLIIYRELGKETD